MPFKHPCFISYVHGQHELMKPFLEQLKSALKAYLEPWFDQDLYIDSEMLEPGEHFNQKLAEAICGSVCMILVYIPKYDQHPYCLREYAAMEMLEEKRLKLLEQLGERGRGLIIPIVLRGKKERLPEKIRNHIHYCDFSKFSTASVNISSNPDYVEQIDGIAQYIADICEKFEDAGVDVCTDCHDFRLPEEQLVKRWKPAPTQFVLREEPGDVTG